MEPAIEASNLVLLMIESLQTNALGTHDPERHTSIMNGIAKRATVFERTFANWTPFSVQSIRPSNAVLAGSDQVEIANLPSFIKDAEFVSESVAAIVDEDAAVVRIAADESAGGAVETDLQTRLATLSYR